MYKESNYFEYVVPDLSMKKIDSRDDNFDIDAVARYPYIREEEKGGGQLQKRKYTLSFKNEIIENSLFLPDKHNKQEKINNLLKDISLKLNTKLYKIFEEEFDGNNPYLIKNSIRSFFLYFLKIKEEYKDNESLLSYINQEMFLQIYRHLNRNDFTEISVKIKTILGFLYIFSHYLEIPIELLGLIERWIKALINQK